MHLTEEPIKIPLSMCYSFVTSVTNACYSDIICTFASQPDDAGTSPRSYIYLYNETIYIIYNKVWHPTQTATKQYDL